MLPSSRQPPPQRDPALVWGWYEWRRGTVMRAQPNSGHRAIATLAARVSQLTLVTQNVDDLHERAGSSPVLHLHGDISRPFCEACRQPHTLATGFPDVAPEGSRIEPPRCMCCGGRVRPGVVWFGESLPQAPWQTALEATRQCDAFICVGTSALVYPAASLALLAIERSVTTLQINPNVTELDAFVTEAIHGTSGEVLPRLVEEVWAASDSAPTFNQ